MLKLIPKIAKILFEDFSPVIPKISPIIPSIGNKNGPKRFKNGILGYNK